jgi:hypothetical protein
MIWSPKVSGSIAHIKGQLQLSGDMLTAGLSYKTNKVRVFE